jgi:cysteine synthase A
LSFYRIRTTPSAVAIDSGGAGGAPASPVSNQRPTPIDGAAAIGSENNNGIDIDDVTDVDRHVHSEINCYQNMSSEQVMTVIGKSKIGGMKIMDLGNLVGNTPLIKLGDRLYAKFETYNPSGSIKDRIGYYILEKAEERGELKPGDTIVEATSGNTGIAVSMFGTNKGYKVIIVMPCNMSEERKQMMRMFGAEVIEVEAGDFDRAIAMRDHICKEDGFFNFNQFHNLDNIACHYETTGVEILQQTEGKKIAAFLDGTGTGGTLMGVGKRLKERQPSIKTLAIEPAESPVMSGGEPGLHGIQGIGDGSKFLVDLDKVDEVLLVKTDDAIERMKQLHQRGLLVGISSGANVLASERWIEENNPDGIVVTILCDRGERYLSCL